MKEHMESNNSSRDFRMRSRVALIETGTESLQEWGCHKYSYSLCSLLLQFCLSSCIFWSPLTKVRLLPFQPVWILCLIASCYSKLGLLMRSQGSNSISFAFLEFQLQQQTISTVNDRGLLALFIFHSLRICCFTTKGPPNQKHRTCYLL